jgi:hypothetical protein
MCTKKTLLAADQQFGFVTQCDCGTLHLTVGVVSLGLDREALRRIHRLIDVALKQLPESPDEAAQITQESRRIIHVH